MTHREFSRNSASSRAIPIQKMIERIQADPAMPVYWGKNQKGMQADQELTESDQAFAKATWLVARDKAILSAQAMVELGIHKQIANRLLEPWMYITVIVSATKWHNFFNLRCHKNAQPEIKEIAVMMRQLYWDSTPTPLREGQWHLPLLPDLQELRANYNDNQLAQISCGRCARVSYLTHDGKRDPQADLNLAHSLQLNGHMSPFEHAAIIQYNRANTGYGNFSTPWLQLRKQIAGESIYQPQET